MIRRPPRSTRTDTLFPYTTLFRSSVAYPLSVEYSNIQSRPITLALMVISFPLGSAVCGLIASELIAVFGWRRSEEHTSELQSLMRISYAVFCLKKKTQHHHSIVSPIY